MSKLLSALSGGSGVAAAGAVAVAIVAGVLWTRDNDAPVVTETAQPAPEPAVVTPAPTAETTETPIPEPTEETAAAPENAPAFDEVRRDPDGTLVIAGRAAPGSKVSILQDDAEIAVAEADGSGRFATIAFVTPDSRGHILSLSQEMEGAVLLSDDQIILAPLDPPVALAEVETPETPDNLTMAALAPEEVPTIQGNGPAESAPSSPAIPQPGSLVATPQGPAIAPGTSEGAPEQAEASTPTTEAPDGNAKQAETAQTEQTEPEESGLTAASPSVETAVVESPAAVQPQPQSQPEEVEGTPPQGDIAKADEAIAPVREVPAAPEDQTATPTARAEATGAETSDDEATTPATRATDSSPNTDAPAPAPASTAPAAPAPATIAAAPETPALTNPDDPATTAPAAAGPPEVALLRSTPEGVEVLGRPSPQVMDNVALDTISYSDLGAVQLAGRAQSFASSVRVYLNNSAIVNLPVDASGRWRGDLPDVDEGIYTLRVDEVDRDGKVSSRVETPFKREAPATLAAAAAQQDGPLKAITVQKGATLWAIARDRYGKGELYVRVFDANRDAIRDPDLIYPGQIFDLPGD
ncbi:MAG: hypothetical protein P1U53_05130 [Sulfitobacter sp.]|nr:hypothetical protein [Sulfitobacter sp.]